MMTLTRAKNRCPAIACCTCRRTRLRFSAPYLSDSRRWRLCVFDKRIPLTESVS